MQFWWGVFTMVCLIFSLIFSSECSASIKWDRPIVHWLFGFLAGVGMLACFICTINGGK